MANSPCKKSRHGQQGWQGYWRNMDQIVNQEGIIIQIEGEAGIRVQINKMWGIDYTRYGNGPSWWLPWFSLKKVRASLEFYDDAPEIFI